jgi:ATP-binding cassette subfamily B multidrug efflux pump
MKHLKALNKYFWKYRLRLATGLLFVLLSNYFNVLAPQLTGYVINFVNRAIGSAPAGAGDQPGDYDILVQKIISMVSGISDVWKLVAVCAIILLVLALLRGFFLFLMRQTLIVMSRHIEYDQKNEVYAHYQQLDALFYKKNNTGDLMNRIAEDVSRVRMFTGPAIMYVANLVTIISLSIFFMVSRSPELTLYVLMPLPILAVIIYFVNMTIHKKSERIQESLSGLTTNAQESYSGIRVIKSFVQERNMLEFFSRNSEEYRQNAVGLARVEAIYFPSITLLIGFSTLLTIMIGGLYYIRHEHNMELGTIVEFIIYVNMLTFPVSAIGLTASMIQRAAASQKRLNEFLQTKPAIAEPLQPLEPVLKGGVQFDNVTMVYPDTGIHALQNFTLDIRPGEKVAITGRTGSGKTTVAQLLLRLYDPVQGNVSVDNVPLKDISLHSLRRQISYVPQDVFLFSDTVANNIGSGIENATREQVVRAAEMAGVDPDIRRFSAGYETMIGERGVTLSGGQKQRISIARALIKDPALIILDDCLSAVDAKTEKEIIGRLNEFLEGKTAIIITHRVFSLLEFDRIVVLDHGRIAEQGTHAELMRIPDGHYASLYARQQQGMTGG